MIKIAKKFILSFGVVIVIILAVAIWSVNGIGNIVTDADEVINGNKLRAELIQRHVDHLQWAKEVNKLLTDINIDHLTIETDPHKCGFGKWYYGQERQDAEKLIPQLKSVLAEIEKPHKDLHNSALEIGKVFKQADRSLGAFLREKKNDHLLWMLEVKDGAKEDWWPNRRVELYIEHPGATPVV